MQFSPVEGALPALFPRPVIGGDVWSVTLQISPLGQDGAVRGELVFVGSCVLWVVLRIVVSAMGAATTVLYHDQRRWRAEADLATTL